MVKKQTAGRSDKGRNDKGAALENTLSQIERQYGKGTIMRLGAAADKAIAGISTASFSLDMALGGAGVPRGRIVEVFGPESSGKTTLALHIIASAQKSGGIAAFVDAEHALDPSYARKLGVNLDDLLVSQPDTGEQALEIVEMLVRSNALDIVVIDSVAALVPRAEIEGEMGDAHVGLQARLMSQALRKLTAAIARSRTCVLFINQIREKIGVFFGNPETTPGGRALKFYSSVRLDIRRIGSLKTGDEMVGSRARVTVVKNKVAPPFQKAEFDILFNRGISRTGDMLDLAVTRKIVDKAGAWFSYGEIRLGQGRDRVVEFLEEHEELLQEIETKLRQAFGLTDRAASEEAQTNAEGVAPPKKTDSDAEGHDARQKSEGDRAKPASAAATGATGARSKSK